MKKHSVLLLLFAAIVLVTMAPAAMAQYCKRCATFPNAHCVDAIRVIGYPDCVSGDFTCELSGDPCDPPPGIAAASFAADYKVAAVERIDEPRPAASAPLTSPAETEPPPAP